MFRPGGVAPKELAHRLTYENEKGPIPKGAFILHSCDNPSCVNPDHLRVGNAKDNVADMDARKRRVSNPCYGESNPNTDFTEPEIIALRLDYVAGLPINTILRRYGCTKAAFHDYVGGRSWAHILGENGCPTLPELKSENRRRTKSAAKLTEDDVRAIRQRLERGDMGKDIAADFGIHKATISDIKNRKIWADIP